MMMTSCLGVRWIPVAGSIGPAAVIFWILGSIIFFIPLSLIVIELSLNFRENGSIALWTKEGLGKKAGFYVAWLYWINSVVYYPGLLTFIAVNLAYLIGDSSLATNSWFIVTIVLICFWGAVFFNIAGIHLVAKLTSLSGLFNFRLGLVLIIAGCYYLASKGHSATTFHPLDFIPKRDFLRNLSDLSILMFALAGVEAIPTICRSMENPERNLFRAIVIGGTMLVLIYIFGTVAINFILSPHELSNTTGLVASVYTLTAKLHWSIWIAKFFIISLMFVEFGGLNLWLITSSIIFFQDVEKGVLPCWLQKLSPNYIPANALIAQGVLVSVIILGTKFLPSVESMYLVLVLMATVIYFIPFLFLILAYINLRRHGALNKKFLPDGIAYPLAITVFVAVSLGIILSFVPNAELKTGYDILIYEIELLGGCAFFLALGIWIYSRRKQN